MNLYIVRFKETRALKGIYFDHNYITLSQKIDEDLPIHECELRKINDPICFNILTTIYRQGLRTDQILTDEEGETYIKGQPKVVTEIPLTNSISQINLEGENFYGQYKDDINEMEEFHNQKIDFKSLEIEEIDSLAMFNSWLDSQDSIDYLKTQWMDMVLFSPLFNHTFFYEMSYDQLNQLTDHELDDIINKFVKKNTHLNKFDENNYHSDIFEYYKKIS